MRETWTERIILFLKSFSRRHSGFEKRDFPEYPPRARHWGWDPALRVVERASRRLLPSGFLIDKIAAVYHLWSKVCEGSRSPKAAVLDRTVLRGPARLSGRGTADFRLCSGDGPDGREVCRCQAAQWLWRGRGPGSGRGLPERYVPMCLRGEVCRGGVYAARLSEEVESRDQDPEAGN